MSNAQKTHNHNKEKPKNLSLTNTTPVTSDRNANSTVVDTDMMLAQIATSSSTHSNSTTSTMPSLPDNQQSSLAVGGTIRKMSRILKTKYDKNLTKKGKSSSANLDTNFCNEAQHDTNYMELEFCDPATQTTATDAAHFTELFCDFPVSYETTTVITAAQFVKNTFAMKPPPQPPPYREPPPPTPPPISQLPTRDPRLLAVELLATPSSAPATPSRGKVVLSKKERKELSKLNKLQNTGSVSQLNIIDNNEQPCGSLSAHCSPYKGRVTELKNCIAKINSRGLFASLNRGSQKSLNISAQQTQEVTPPSSNEISPPAPAPETSPPLQSNTELTANNNENDYIEKLKNLPVRQRKAHISHMENYCLFDPVDFINEKAYRNHLPSSTNLLRTAHGLRDPLFSSQKNLDFGEELVPEVIYPDDNEAELLEIELEHELIAPHNDEKFTGATGEEFNQKNFDHHNYFVIDPEDFEDEPLLDVGIPNPLSNEQHMNTKLEQLYVDEMPASSSIDKLLDAAEAASSLSNSQESKDITTTASNTTTTTTSTALLESSTSTSSNSSSTSSTTLSQTTLQRTKKKLTFLNLSPFRSQNSKNLKDTNDTNDKTRVRSTDSKSERAISALVSSDHMLHLQNMLLDNKESLRSRTVPIESNYVLFNPGPVPSRNVQYKIRKPRPLSTNSDADSGFLSPCSPDDFSAMKFNPAILVLQQCDSVQGYIEIYTDWANYYLERAKSKKKVTDLSADCRDGLLLADVIEAVTSFKVPDLVKKPKSQQQMHDNVNSCLNLLRAHAVGGLDNITTSDICAGRLKAVLALFFALSRYKQQSKQKSDLYQQPPTTTAKSTTPNANVVVQQNQQQQQQQHQLEQPPSENGNETMVNRQIPTAYTKANGGTSIPLPATVMVQRRCPPDKVRPLPPTPNHTPSIPGLSKVGGDFHTSRPNSPPTSNHTIQSHKSGNNNGLRPPTIKTSQQQSGIPPPSSIASAAIAPPTTQKHSMLDKLKLFNKEKQQSQTTALSNKNPTQSKRTSSSSGFSSARSERSDSSLSLNDGHISQIKPPAVSVTSASKTRDSKLSTKQSKLLAAQLKKEQTKASKLEKLDRKEKSPARSLNKEDISGSLESRSSTIGRSKNSLPRLTDKSSIKSSSKTSLNSKSESKSSLVTASTKNLNSPSGTGLPKPIAAIKGTSKLPQTPPILGGDVRGRTITNSGSNNELLKHEKNDISNPTLAANISVDRKDIKPIPNTNQQHILKPIAILPEPGSKSPFYANTANISQSPHHMISAAEPTYITSSRLPPPKTNGPTTPTRKLDYNTSSNLLSSPQRTTLRPLSHTTLPHMQSCSQPATPVSSPRKFHTIPSKIGPGGVGSTIFEEEKPHSVLPMRPLLRGYNSHVTLPTRGLRGGAGNHCGVNDFAEADNVQSGYCSDSDSLRIRNTRLVHGSGLGMGATSSRLYDVDMDGYLSEGSGGVGHHGSPIVGAPHGKNFLSMMRARTQLPTTIEERIDAETHLQVLQKDLYSALMKYVRIRNSRGSLDSIGTVPPSSATSQASSGGSNNKMDGNSNIGSGNASANASPQHHAHRSSSRNGRENWTKVTEPHTLNGHKSEKADKSSPSHSRRNVSGSNSGGGGSPSKQGSPSSRTKGVPPSFGYVKRSNGCATSTAEQQNIIMMGANSSGSSMAQSCLQGGRTAHVSAVPRTTTGGRKISGGTQTLPSEHMSRIPPNTQHRSFSLTGPGASQLSQSIRERLAAGSHSLPKPGTDLHMFQQRIPNRPSKMIDGSLSDTQTYAEVKPEYSTYAMWLKHSNTAGSRLSEGDSLENMQIGSPAMTRHGHKMLQHRTATVAGSITHGTGTESPYVQSPRLNRSNSIRSTKSEKMYPSMLSRGPDVEIEPYYCLPVGTIGQNGVISAQMAAAAAAAATHISGQSGVNNSSAAVAWSQPTSPTPINRGFGGTLSPTHAGTITMAGLTGVPPGGHRLTYPKKNDDVHGSAASLLSGGSSLYGSAEERQANEIRRLKRELMDAREQVLSLSSQLSTNAHVVSAFEQSLSNMTSRLHHLTATAERKDGELTDMRQTIELLRKQSIQAGLTTAHMQSMGVQTQNQSQNELFSGKPPPLPAANSQQLTNRTATPSKHQNGTNGGSPSKTGVGGGIQRHHSSDSMCSLNSVSSGCSAHDKKQKKKGWLRSSFTKAFSRNAKISKTSRHAGHHHPHQQQQSNQHGHGHTLKEISNANKTNGHGGSHAESVVGLAALATQPAPPLVNSATNNSPTKGSPAKTVTLIENAKPIDAIEHDEHHVVEELKKQLREKDLVLTDIRLEALSSASQLENLKDTVNKMRAEMMSLKQNNERLQKLVTTRSLAGSEASLGNPVSPSGSIGESRRYSLADGNARPPMELPKRLEEEVEEENIPPAPAPEPPPLSPTTHIDLTPPPPALESIATPTHISAAVEELPDMSDGKKIAIACYLGQPESFQKYCEEMLEADDFYANGGIASNGIDLAAESNERPKSYTAPSPNEFVIAYTYISGKTTWQNLDYIVRKTFKDYLSTIDPGTNLGLNTDSITSYHLGEAKRGPEMGFPELLPCGYIVGNVRTLYICLQGVGSLAFDSLIPRSIVHRYISLMTEHRRLILCGPSGTGKSYLARRLAEFLVARTGRGNPSEAIATFNVDHKSSKELRQYLGHVAEQATIANGASELPSVIILDNLHHASALGDVFSCLLSAGPAAKLPCIIGTMSQATCNTTNLQLHHNFRWVLTANHMEPVKGFLGRFLRRRLFQLELQTQHPQPELSAVLAWLPTVWQHINRFLETHSSSDVTIGPRLFLSCPLDLKDSQVWFTDIWNYHLSPYLVEAVREGVQLYGRRGGAWNDPSAFIRNSYPWPYGPDSVPPLRQINAEDVGLEGVTANNGENPDPLLNMLMRLQEAANYSENQDPESDCASLDSNITPDSSAGAE